MTTTVEPPPAPSPSRGADPPPGPWAGSGVLHRIREIWQRPGRGPDAARLVPVDWDVEASHLYPVTIKIEAWDRTGLLRDIATVVAEQRINMSAASVHVYDDKTAVVSTTVEIDSLSGLSRLLEKLEQVRDVRTVAREAAPTRMAPSEDGHQ